MLKFVADMDFFFKAVTWCTLQWNVVFINRRVHHRVPSCSKNASHWLVLPHSIFISIVMLLLPVLDPLYRLYRVTPHSAKVRFLIWLAWLFIINLPPFTKHGCHWGSLCKTRKSGIQAPGLSVQWRYSGITLYYVQCFQNGGETLMYWFSYQSALLDFSFTPTLLTSPAAVSSYLPSQLFF